MQWLVSLMVACPQSLFLPTMILQVLMFFFAPYSLDLLLFPVCVDVHHSLPSIVIALVFFVFLLLPLPCLFLPLHRKESKRSHCGIALVITLPSFRIGCFFHSVSSNLKGMNLKFFRKADENGRRKHGNKSIYIYIYNVTFEYPKLQAQTWVLSS